MCSPQWLGSCHISPALSWYRIKPQTPQGSLRSWGKPYQKKSPKSILQILQRQMGQFWAELEFYRNVSALPIYSEEVKGLKTDFSKALVLVLQSQVSHRPSAQDTLRRWIIIQCLACGIPWCRLALAPLIFQIQISLNFEESDAIQQN